MSRAGRSRTLRRIAAAGLAGLLLLSACGQAPVAVTEPPAPPAAAPDLELQSVDERQMVTLFKVLLDLDRREELRLAAGQAERMLPLIEASGERGALSAADFARILALMSPAQMAHYEQTTEHLRRLRQAIREASSEAGGQLSSEEMKALVERFERRRASTEGQESDPGPWTPAPDAPPMGKERSLERQVIDMLRERMADR